jgi:hypothetical protein
VLGKDFDYLLGKYIVYKITMDGGSTLHGYDNGYHVHCLKADNKDIKVDFYQNGSFTAVITDISSIGRAELKWDI